ncbi:hypothetical protein B0T16DRAFT_387667 [Cercophora newfieldiana]|uniref:Uncharacterized protein n=1 Tax=Cercophora newfieldiana TaxID=92897 RepID=A0AA39YH19_9PEZI|nr:hypothetical protein B0T16DRAFT_387667 [Cercophora newfieldiana]
MQLSLLTLTTILLLSSLATALPPSGLDVLQARQECGVKNGRCDENGCAGVSNPITGIGICQGAFFSCPCVSVCGKNSGSCSDNQCAGVATNNSDVVNEGRCTAGPFNGCFCFLEG